MNVDLHPRPDPTTYISLCTGGGGLDLGLGLALPDARAVCLVEREAFACAHLVAAMQSGLMAPAPLWSDARTFDGRHWRGLVDGVIGGIPCQPHSVAGRKRGAKDPRDLWSDARRCLVQSGAWWCLIENVPGMLVAGEDEIAGAARVRRDLDRLGFRVAGGLFSAAEVGASHERQRIFLLGVADAEGNGWREGRPEPIVRGGRPAVAGDGEHMDDTASSRGRAISIQPGQPHQADSDLDGSGLFPPGPDDRFAWADILARAPHLEPAIRRMADGMATGLELAAWHAYRVDRLRLLGNGVVPLVAAHAIRTLLHRLAADGCAGAIELVRMTGVML